MILEANATWIDGSVTLLSAGGTPRTLNEWEKQPGWLANVQLAYEKGPFGAKVAFNHVGSFLNNVNEDNAIYDIHRRARSEVDFQLRYAVTDTLKVLFEVQNLTKEHIVNERRFEFGNLLAQDTEKGRRIWLGVSWRAF